jgi:L-ascorbate metabolism protein UlaG (beta-lactamase superfamily)
VLINVYDPALLSKPAVEQDILLTSHHHHDHYQADFTGSFSGQQIDRQAGEVVAADVRITSIPSSHNAGERLRLAGGSNYIFLIEIGGLRIVHFGDIGQDRLTPDQLEVLKPVDVAISQLRNPYSEMGMQDLKGFVLMDQVQPGLFIPTHANLETIQYALIRWTGYLSDADSVFIDPARLSRAPGMLLFGLNAQKYGDDFPLEIW